jgi:hypothetical protein
VIAFRKYQEKEARSLIEKLQSNVDSPETICSGFWQSKPFEIERMQSSGFRSPLTLIRLLTLAQPMPLSRMPIDKQELWPYDDVAGNESLVAYQRKINTLLYAAVITRPDIPFGPKHHEGADPVLYLKRTHSLALQFGGEDQFSSRQRCFLH